MRDQNLLLEVSELMAMDLCKEVVEMTDGVAQLLAAREVLSLPEDYDQRKKLIAQRRLTAMENTRTYKVYTQILRKRRSAVGGNDG